jgi:uncharacterized protein (TIGR03067 family)
MRLRTCILVGALALLAAEGGDDASRKDLAAMQGDWQCLAMTVDGQVVPDDDAQGLFRTVKGDQYTVSRYDKAIGKGTIKLDATKSPKEVDATPAGPAGKAGPMKGIYEVGPDTLKLCFARPGKDRPKDFTSKAGAGHTLTVWTREKP